MNKNDIEMPPQADPVLGKTFAEVLGEIVWLMTQSKDTRQMEIGEIERLVMPGILLKQFHIQYAELPPVPVPGVEAGPDDGAAAKRNLQPICVEVFAMVSDAVASALSSDASRPLTLQDWRSGPTKHAMLSVSIGGNV